MARVIINYTRMNSTAALGKFYLVRGGNVFVETDKLYVTGDKG